jgi:hypothetical protein
MSDERTLPANAEEARITDAMNLTSKIVTAFVFVILLSACKSPQPLLPQVENPRSALQEQKPDVGRWYIQEPEVNPIDGVKTQIIRTDDIGSNVVLCFRNGKLCPGNHVGVYISSPCWVDGGEDEYTRYKRRVRLRFDSDKFSVENWNITDDHRGIFPPSKKSFISSLKAHKSLMFEFGCDRSDPGVVVTFDIHGLQAAVQAANVTL